MNPNTTSFQIRPRYTVDTNVQFNSFKLTHRSASDRSRKPMRPIGKRGRKVSSFCLERTNSLDDLTNVWSLTLLL